VDVAAVNSLGDRSCQTQSERSLRAHPEHHESRMLVHQELSPCRKFIRQDWKLGSQGYETSEKLLHMNTGQYVQAHEEDMH